MKSIPQDQLSKVSFPDCDITFFKLSPFHLEMRLDGLYLEGCGLVTAPVHVVVSGWSHASITRYNLTGAEPQVLIPARLDLCECGELTDICEWSVTDFVLSFSGFEKFSGEWQEFVFSNAAIEIRIDE